MSWHTPGRWNADAIAENGDVRINHADIPVVIASVHNAVSAGRVMLGLHPQEQWGNAYLIAAAPDLLAACRELLDFGRMLDADHEMLARGADAIARANGEGAP